MTSAQACIFDLDGTLADTIPLICDAWNAAVPMYTHRTYSREEVIERFGIPDEAMIRREIPGRSAEHAIETYMDYYARHHDRVRVFDGVAELLEELKKRDLRLGLMSGKGRRTADITLQKLGWTDLFAAVVTGDEVEHQKPDPEGVLKVAKALHVEPASCAFIGDSPADMGAGRQAKMFTIAAGWASVFSEKLRQEDPDAFADHPSDVLKWIVSPRHDRP